MASVNVHRPDVELASPTLVEGLPGIGLAGKIVTDHLLEVHEFEHVASVLCETLPQISVYAPDERGVRAPVRLHANPEGSVVVLSSDVPVSLEESHAFVDCLVGWIDHNDVFPVFLSGRPREQEEDRGLFGVGHGTGIDRLADLDVDVPAEAGAISGPTGALLHRCSLEDIDAVGLVVESDVQFPDPTAAKAIIEGGVDPLTGLETDVRPLVDRASEIQAQREGLAESMQRAGQESSSQAQPLRMFQ